MRFEYAGETPFWYFLAKRTMSGAESKVTQLLKALNQRANQIGLPIIYAAPHALVWAVLCQLYRETQPRAAGFGNLGFNMMIAGFSKAFGPPGFVESAFKRILGNIKEPASPDRSYDQSIVDTFLLAALKLVNEKTVDTSWDMEIMEACLTDEKMIALGREACSPTAELWVSAVREYAKRRPGPFRRNFTNPDKWLFG